MGLIKRYKTRKYFNLIMDQVYDIAGKYGLFITELNPNSKYSVELAMCNPRDIRVGMILTLSIKDDESILISNIYNTSLGNDALETLNKHSRQLMIPYIFIRNVFNTDLDRDFWNLIVTDLDRMMDLKTLSYLV